LFAVFTCVLLLSNVARGQRPEWTLLLKTSGATTLVLSVIENDGGQIPASTSKLALSPSPSDTQAVYEQVLKSFANFS
jgi:hypothetical protein